MNTYKLKDFTKGWFIGNFEPTLIDTQDFEVGVKSYKKGDIEAPHFHAIAKEYTIMSYGKAKMCDIEIEAGDIVVLNPGDITGFEALTDCQTVVVKTPSVMGDKYSYNIKDYSAVIQGPLSESTIPSIDTCLKYVDKVVVSYWDDSDKWIEATIIDKYIDKNVKFVRTKKDTYKDSISEHKVYAQLVTTLNGLVEIDTKYCFKIRSDEIWPDLSKAIVRFAENDNKILTSDLFFRRDGEYKYHISDHVILSKTQVLLDGFKTAKRYYDDGLTFNHFDVHMYPEQVITYSLLLEMLKNNNDGTAPNATNSKYLMQKYVIINPLSNGWGDVVWTANCYGIKNSMSKNWCKTVREVAPNEQYHPITSIGEI